MTWASIMNKMKLIIVLLVLHVSITKIYANKTLISPIDPSKCKAALLKNKKELSTHFEAIEREDVDKLLTLKDMNWDLETRYKSVQIHLSYAAQKSKVQSIRVLVSQVGADVNGRDKNGLTALHYAVLNPDILSRTNTIYTLVQLGADIYTTDHLGRRPSEYVQGERGAIINQDQRHKAIYLAIKTNDPLEVAELLQITYNILLHLVRSFRTSNDLQIH